MFEVTLWVNGEVSYSAHFNNAADCEEVLGSTLGFDILHEKTKSVAWSITGPNTDLTGAWERVQ